MFDIAAIVTSLGGMAQKQQLVARGARDVDLTLAVRSDSVQRARQGWYTTLPNDDLGVRAVRVGGRLTGMSAVIALGGWAFGTYPLHVSVHANAARLRTPSSRFVKLAAPRPRRLRLHWDGASVASRGTATAVDLRDALVQVVLDEDLETAVAALDWAIHTQRITRADFDEIVRALPRRRRTIRDWVDPACESLPESLTRTRMRLLGHSVQSQVRLGERERIDLVIDECVGLEVDGEEFHLDRFESDRMKDLGIASARLGPLRPSARAVFYHWPTVVRAVDGLLATRAPSQSPAISAPDPSHPRIVPAVSRRGRRRRRVRITLVGNTRGSVALTSG